MLDLIADGCTNRQIAERLFLAEKTVKSYVSALLAKLGMQRRTQAVVYGAGLRRRGPGRGVNPAKAPPHHSPGASVHNPVQRYPVHTGHDGGTTGSVEHRRT